LRLWDTETGSQILSVVGHDHSLECVAFSPDGTRLASGSVDRTVRIWDALSGQEVLVLKGHSEAVTSVAFSPDGARLVSASRDRTVRFWDAGSGDQTLVLKGHTGRVRSVGFTPDGRRILSRAERPEEIRAWDASTGKPIPPGDGLKPAAAVCLSAHSPDNSLSVSAEGSLLLVRPLNGPRTAQRQNQTREGLFDAGAGIQGMYYCTGTNSVGRNYGGITVEIRKRGGDVPVHGEP
jgi:WD40 repeat protein